MCFVMGRSRSKAVAAPRADQNPLDAIALTESLQGLGMAVVEVLVRDEDEIELGLSGLQVFAKFVGIEREVHEIGTDLEGAAPCPGQMDSAHQRARFSSEYSRFPPICHVPRKSVCRFAGMASMIS